MITPKNSEIQDFEPPKNDPSLRMYENIKSTSLGLSPPVKYFTDRFKAVLLL